MPWSSSAASSSMCCHAAFRRCGTTGSWGHTLRSRSKPSAGSSRSTTAPSSSSSRPRQPPCRCARRDAAPNVAVSCGSSPSSPNAPQPFTTRADRIPPVRHALPPPSDAHRASRDSDAVRAWRAGRRCTRPATRKKTPWRQPAAGLRDPVGLGERHDRTSVTLSVTPRRRLRFPPLP